MHSEAPGLSLFDGMSLAGMSFHDVWLGQLALGGDADTMSVEAYVLGLLSADSYSHNLIAQAINEQFIDAGGNHPVGYR